MSEASLRNLRTRTSTSPKMWRFLSLLILTLLAAVHAVSTAGNRLLVVLEEQGDKGHYSKFWKDLESRGYKLSFESPKNDKLALFLHGERAYDHLILFPPKSKGLGPALTPALLLQFINSNGNILLGLSSSSPTPSSVSSLLLELDISLPPDRNSLVVDHFNYDTLSAAEKHDVLLLPRPKPLREDVKNFFGGEGADEVLAFPRGVGQTLGNESPLLAPILRAPDTAYAYNPKEEAETVEEPFATGRQLALVTALQARNSARFVVSGSVEAFADQWFGAKVKGPAQGAKAQKTANQAFARELSAWAFKEAGVLKVGKVEHHLANDTTEGNPKMYRVKNDVTFSIELSEYVNGQYVPYEPPASDAIQLEFSMLSPFHRLALTPSSKTADSTIFTTSFTVPDQHGMFTFRVNYKRPFLSSVDEKRIVTVRHFAHDEWPRSWEISGAWVWVAGIAVTVVGWLGFVAVWLYSEPPRGGGAAGGKKVQ
ncbi:MAG: oligosaccharyl transferase glycoprotein complex, beta subunit [Thelocarpon impressellum]|nr:MAG: oligosaccharyl transferase glycoprotein complex, beta subunit [Thelocarpon impressellum]